MNKQILNLAVPNIITNITVPLLGMVDTSIAGHLENELYIGAIAVATMIFNFIYWNFSFLRMGTSGFTAQAYGAMNQQEVVNILFRSLLVAFSAGLVIIMLQHFILFLAFSFIKTGQETLKFASDYFYIYVWAAPVILGMYALTGWFIGMQDARTPMIISIITNILNIGLSLLFVFIFKMQLKGVACGSLISQLFAFGLAITIWNFKYKYLRKYISLHFIKHINEFKPFFKVNRDIFLRSLALVLVTTFFTAASTRLGDTYLAVNSLLMQLFILFSYMMDGFAYAAEALTGKFTGARDSGLLTRAIKYLFAWGIGLTILFTLIYALFSDNILNLLTDKGNIIQAAKEFRIWAILFPIAGFAAFLWDGIFVGLKASRQMRNSMFIAVIIFFVVYYSLIPFYSNNALWLAFIIYLSIRGIVQSIMFKTIRQGLSF